MHRVLLLGVLLGSAGCGRVVEPDPGTREAVFPHPADYAEGPHGTEALADPAACVQCHDPGASPWTSAGSGPSCGSCHTYPHPGLRPGAAHGPAWLVEPATCAGCHGTSGERAPAEVTRGTCTSCHHTFPHPTGFASTHGAAVRTRAGPEACAGCHGIHEATAGDPGACVRCHQPGAEAGPYPHPPGFGAPSTHGPVADATCTEGCHAPAWTGLGPGCETCHDLYPHAEGFAQGGHIPAVQSRGERACQSCHAPGRPTAPTMPVSCAASCHGGGR